MMIIEEISGIYTPNLLLLIQVENPSRYYIGIAVAVSVFESFRTSDIRWNKMKQKLVLCPIETLIYSQEKTEHAWPHLPDHF